MQNLAMDLTENFMLLHAATPFRYAKIKTIAFELDQESFYFVAFDLHISMLGRRSR